MSYLSICKNVIAANNKRNWKKPDPAIRISNTPSGKIQSHEHSVGIVDAKGNIVARIVSTKDGKPVIKCGAKVGIVTEYPVVSLDK